PRGDEVVGEQAQSDPRPRFLLGVVPTAGYAAPPRDDPHAPSASRPPLLSLLEPALLFASTPFFTARVPIRNRNILHAQGLSPFFVGPRVKTGVGRHPSRNPA